MTDEAAEDGETHYNPWGDPSLWPLVLTFTLLGIAIGLLLGALLWW